MCELLHAFLKHVSMEWLHIDSPYIRPKLKSWRSSNQCDNPHLGRFFKKSPDDLWGVEHTNHLWHHPSTSLAVIMWKVMGQHLFLDIIPNNFTVGTGRKVWCDQAMNQRVRSTFHISMMLSSIQEFIHPSPLPLRCTKRELRPAIAKAFQMSNS